MATNTINVCIVRISYLADIVVADVPVGAVPDVKARPVLLHDDARDNILERLAQVVQFLHASVTNRVHPVRNLTRRGVINNNVNVILNRTSTPFGASDGGRGNRTYKKTEASAAATVGTNPGLLVVYP